MLGEGSHFRLRARAGDARSLFGDVMIDIRGLAWNFEGERRDNATFAGTQGQTKDELAAEGLDVTRFGYDRAATQLALRRPLGPLLSVEAAAGLAFWTFNNGTSSGGDPTIDEVYCVGCAAGEVDEALVPGFNEGVRRVQTRVALGIDSRADARFSSGVAARVAGTWAHGIAGDSSHDAGASADVIGTLNLEDRAVGVRLRASLVESIGDAPVPFIDLVQASGRYGIRGLRTGRLRGNTAFVGSAFYRYLLTPNIDFMLFADYGGAFGSWFDGFSADHLIDSYGVSLWLYGTNGRYFEGSYLARIEAAWAPGEGSRIVLVTHLD
jgi:outer membrane protein assembly factor BamA